MEEEQLQTTVTETPKEALEFLHYCAHDISEITKHLKTNELLVEFPAYRIERALIWYASDIYKKDIPEYNRTTHEHNIDLILLREICQKLITTDDLNQYVKEAK